MSAFDTLPPLVGVLVGLLAILGAALTLIGSFGLLRLPTFYERVHPPTTMGTTAGVCLTLAASMLLFSSRVAAGASRARHRVFTIVTTPVTYMLLVRAAVHRDRTRREELDAEVGAKRDDLRSGE